MTPQVRVCQHGLRVAVVALAHEKTRHVFDRVFRVDDVDFLGDLSRVMLATVFGSCHFSTKAGSPFGSVGFQIESFGAGARTGITAGAGAEEAAGAEAAT